MNKRPFLLRVILKISKYLPFVHIPIYRYINSLPKECYSLNDLDRKLRKYIPFTNGYFVEAGANDGISQSNTYYFSLNLGWKGILVEAIPDLAEKCKVNRPKCIVENYALVSYEYAEKTIKMKYCNLMSVVKGNMSEIDEDAFMENGAKIQGDLVPYEIDVPVSTLSKIIEKHNPKRIDLFSLDVEGYESEVLSGINFHEFKPTYILIEAIWNKGKIFEALQEYYEMVDQLSEMDYLFRRKE